LVSNDPFRKNQHGWVTSQSAREHLRALDAEIHPVVLDRRESRLGDSRPQTAPMPPAPIGATIS